MSKLEEAAARRASEVRALSDRPRERRWCEQASAGSGVRMLLSPTSLRSETRDGLDGVLIPGVASTTEDPYEMYDFFGPYTEIVSAGAFGKTLASSPLVEFTLNHNYSGGAPMAHTRNGTLELEETDDGLVYGAFVDPTRSDVSDMVKAIERGDLGEASFKFRITKGMWSPDYTEYRIEEVDLNRGDVSAVNFGANPNASTGARSAATQSPSTAREHVPSMRDHISEDDLAPLGV